MKRIFVCIVFLVVLICLMPFDITVVNALDEDENDSESLTDVVYEQLNNLDLSDLQDYLNNLDNNGQSLFGNTSIINKISSIISGDLDNDFGTFFSLILNTIFSNLTSFLPLIASLLVVGILYNIIGSLIISKDDSIKSIVEFVCFSIVIIIISAIVFKLLTTTNNTITSIKDQMDIILPIELTLLTSIGSVTSVGFFQPIATILSNLVVQLFSYIIIPLYICCFIFIVVGNLSNSIKLDKFQSLFNSIFKWSVGIIFATFSSMIFINALVAGNYDNVSLKVTKFALKNYIPILGGYLSDGVNIVTASSIIIKNAVGLVGVLLIFSSIFSPIIEILVFSLCLKFVSAILEPIGATKISNFVHQISKLNNYLLTIILAVGFMYVLTLGVLISIANII